MAAHPSRARREDPRRGQRLVSSRAWLAAAIGLLGVCGISLAEGPEVSVRAYVEPRGPHPADRPLELVIEASGSSVPDLSVAALPQLENLHVVAGPSRGSFSEFRFDASGAHRLVRRTLRYTLLPSGPGPARIPSVSVQLGREIVETAPIDLQIAPAGPAPQPPAPAPRSPSPRLPPGPAPDRGPDREQEEESGGLWVEARSDSDTVWQGQPLQLEVVVYAAARLAGLQFLRVPELDDFWVEPLQVDPAREAYRAERGGREVLAYPVLRYVLAPNRAGELTIEPFVIQAEVERRTGDLWEDFFSFGRRRSLVRQSSPLALKVMPLPPEGRPSDFSGAVGSFRMRAELDREQGRVHEALALRVSVEGQGFLDAVPPPPLDLGDAFRVFEPRADSSREVRDGRLVTAERWEWVLVPLVAGERELPAVRFSFFDPGSGSYRTLESRPGRLRVEAAPASAEAVAGSSLAQAPREIAFIKPLEGRLSTRGGRVYGRPWFVALGLLPVVWVPLAVWLARRRAKRAGVRGTRRAYRRARRRLGALERRARSESVERFYTALNRLLMDYVASRLDRAPAGLTYEASDRGLAARGVPEETRRRLRLLLERSDFARYVPEAGSAADAGEALREAREVLEAIERAAP